MELVAFLQQRFKPQLSRLGSDDRVEVLEWAANQFTGISGAQLNNAVSLFEAEIVERLSRGAVPHLDAAYAELKKRRPIKGGHTRTTWDRQVEDACKETLRRFFAGAYEAWGESPAFKAFYEAFADRINGAYAAGEDPLRILHAVLAPLRTVDFTDYRRIDGTTIRNAHKTMNVIRRQERARWRGHSRDNDDDDDLPEIEVVLLGKPVTEKRMFFPLMFADDEEMEACLRRLNADCDLDGCDEDGAPLLRLSVGDGLGQWATYRPDEHGYKRVFKS